MTTGEKVLIVGGAAVAIFVVWKLRAGGALLPAAAVPATSSYPGQTTVNTLANAGGTAAGWVGTAVGSEYLGPAGKLVGTQAAIDTKFNIQTTGATAVRATQDIAAGNYGGAVADTLKGVKATAVKPLQTTYSIVKSLF